MVCGRKGQHIKHLKNRESRKIRQARLKLSEADKAHNPCQEGEQCKQWMPISKEEIFFFQSQQRNVF